MLRASTFNFERLDILRDSVRHPSKRLLSFELAQSFRIEFRASRYITGLNQTSELKVIVVSICSEHRYSISSLSIYYRTPSDIRVKTLLSFEFSQSFNIQFRASRYITGSINHPSKKLLSFELAQSFNIKFRESRYVTGLYRTYVKKVIVV